MELFMQIYALPADQQLAMREQNRALHLLVWDSYLRQSTDSALCSAMSAPSADARTFSNLGTQSSRWTVLKL